VYRLSKAFTLKDERTRSEQKIDISDLKLWAAQTLSSTSPLRGVLLLEQERLSVENFLAKMDTWLKLVELED